jgi:hypothetical protein
MESNRVIILFLALTAFLAVGNKPCAGNQKDEQSIFEQDDRGPERGPRRGGPGRGRFELTDEEIDRILKDLKEHSPEKAKKLTELRKKEEPDKFREELWKQAPDEFGKVFRERMEKRREKWLQERREAFLEWLGENMPEEAKELAGLKETSPDHYGEKYELVWRKYGRIYDEGRRNPELAKILLEDVRLQKRRDDLIARIKTTKNERQQKKLQTELEEVIGLRYDLIVRRKQMAYEWLLKRLEALQNQINESRAEILKAQDPEVKKQNIEKRTEELLEKKKGFPW